MTAPISSERTGRRREDEEAAVRTEEDSGEARRDVAEKPVARRELAEVGEHAPVVKRIPRHQRGGNRGARGESEKRAALAEENVERERKRARCAPAELAFEAVAPKDCAAEDAVAPDGEIVPPLLQRFRDMDSAFA